MFVAVDRTSKFAFVELHREAKRYTVGEFLHHLVEAVPYKISIVLTDNGTHFTTPAAGGSATPLIIEALAKGEAVWAHAFEYACAELGIEHRTTKPKHPWTNGQVERMNRTGVDPVLWTPLKSFSGVSDAAFSRCLSAGVPATDGGAGPIRTNA